MSWFGGKPPPPEIPLKPPWGKRRGKKFLGWAPTCEASGAKCELFLTPGTESTWIFHWQFQPWNGRCAKEPHLSHTRLWCLRGQPQSISSAQQSCLWTAPSLGYLYNRGVHRSLQWCTCSVRGTFWELWQHPPLPGQTPDTNQSHPQKPECDIYLQLRKRWHKSLLRDKKWNHFCRYRSPPHSPHLQCWNTGASLERKEKTQLGRPHTAAVCPVLAAVPWIRVVVTELPRDTPVLGQREVTQCGTWWHSQTPSTIPSGSFWPSEIVLVDQ